MLYTCQIKATDPSVRVTVTDQATAPAAGGDVELVFAHRDIFMMKICMSIQPWASISFGEGPEVLSIEEVP